jgi:hypothetical protein
MLEAERKHKEVQEEMRRESERQEREFEQELQIRRQEEEEYRRRETNSGREKAGGIIPSAVQPSVRSPQ